MAKVRILIDNNKSRVVGDARVVHELSEAMKLKAPGYFFSPQYRRRVWDGYTRYITEAGMFQTGLIDLVVKELDKLKCKYTFEDERAHFKDLNLVTDLGGKTLRGYQLASVKALFENKFGDVKFIRGILDEATNAGKNLIAAAIMASFSKKRRGLFLIDNTVIYAQAIKELEELLPGQIGHIQGKNIKWGRLTVCMVQSLANLIKKDPKSRAEVAKTDIVMIDECDSTAGKKTCKAIMTHCYDAPIRIGLSGTPLMHKHPTKNRLIQAYFGPVIHKTSSEELVKLGVSSKPYIRIMEGNTIHRYDGDYVKEYRRGIIKSKERNRKIWKIVARQLGKDRGPILILIKNHAHIAYLLKEMPYEMETTLTYTSVHHKTMGREQKFKDFMDGKTDILIASMIIKRGLNIGVMKTLINAAGGDSETNVVQILGRGLRKIKGVKEKIWVYDFWDIGMYLRRHSNHRLRFYKNQKFPVKELYKR